MTVQLQGATMKATHKTTTMFTPRLCTIASTKLTITKQVRHIDPDLEQVVGCPQRREAQNTEKHISPT